MSIQVYRIVIMYVCLCVCTIYLGIRYKLVVLAWDSKTRSQFFNFTRSLEISYVVGVIWCHRYNHGQDTISQRQASKSAENDIFKIYS